MPPTTPSPEAPELITPPEGLIPPPAPTPEAPQQEIIQPMADYTPKPAPEVPASEVAPLPVEIQQGVEAIAAKNAADLAARQADSPVVAPMPEITAPTQPEPTAAEVAKDIIGLPPSA